MVTTTRLLNKNKEKDCISVTFDRKYYQTTTAFIKRSLRPQEWQVSTFHGRIIVPRLGEERLLNEAAALEFIAKNTTIPVPKVLACFEDDGAVYLITELIDARRMDDLTCSDRIIIEEELEGYAHQMHTLRSRNLGGCSGLVIPPYRVWDKTPRDEWKLHPSEVEEYVILASGPERFERAFYKRVGASVALEGEADDVDEMLKFMNEKLVR
ncbi:hypothetical protein D6D04_06743 [Aureobasidium pullulans]|nr:hypothetical protein D6D04_06743 [Aureobasidium pullulans]